MKHVAAIKDRIVDGAPYPNQGTVKVMTVDTITLWEWLMEARKRRDSVAIQAISYVLCRVTGDVI